eukprot:EG_transcript_13855
MERFFHAAASWKGVGLALSTCIGLRVVAQVFRRSIGTTFKPLPPARQRTGVLLVNTGTPDSTQVRHVRKYLRQFLSDPRVIDLPFIPRWCLVNLIIAPIRAFSSAKLYRRIFTERGSPLKFHGLDVADLLQKELGDGFHVRLAMRYQSPSMEDALAEMYAGAVDHIILIPLFPQYASASAGSVIDRFLKIISKWWRIPHMSIVSNFWDNEIFLTAWEQHGRQYINSHQYDKIVFSYHGVPERHIKKGSCGDHCRLNDSCCSTYSANNAFCYRAQCLHTSQALAQRLGLAPGQHETAFQSRLGRDKWLQPYMQDRINGLIAEGKKKVLVFCPSFVADCLETTSELGIEAKEEFLLKGGERWDVVPCLNADPLWVKSLREMVLRLDVAHRQVKAS